MANKAGKSPSVLAYIIYGLKLRAELSNVSLLYQYIIETLRVCGKLPSIINLARNVIPLENIFSLWYLWCVFLVITDIDGEQQTSIFRMWIRQFYDILMGDNEVRLQIFSLVHHIIIDFFFLCKCIEHCF